MDEFRKHCSNLIALVVYKKELLFRDETDLFCDFKLGDEFTERSFGYVKKPYEFGIRLSLSLR